jgi:hypothetical protein
MPLIDQLNLHSEDGQRYIVTRSSRRDASEMDTAMEEAPFAVLHPDDPQAQVQEKVTHAFEHSDDQFTIVCAVGAHWTLLAIDKEQQCYRYLDFYGKPMPASLKASLSACPDLQGFTELPHNTHTQQYDMTSCGVWVLHNASMVREHGIDYDCANTGDRAAADALIKTLRLQNEHILDDAIRDGKSLDTRTYSQRSTPQEHGSLDSQSDHVTEMTAEQMINNLQRRQPQGATGSPTSPPSSPGGPRQPPGCCVIL